MNSQITIVFIVQFIIGIVSSLVGNIELIRDGKNLGYLFPLTSETSNNKLTNNNNSNNNNSGVQISVSSFFITMGTWIVLINNIVPISLLMTLEMVKCLQGLFISWDYHMYDKINHQQPKVQTSTLNEELGQVKFIFSDKTGTLTKNYMEYKGMSINGKIYGMKKGKKTETNDIQDTNKKKKKEKKDEYGIITNYNFQL